MRKLFILCLILFLTNNCIKAEEQAIGEVSQTQIKTFCEHHNWGLQDSNGNIIVKPEYKKLIPLGDTSFIVQKHGKFGLINSNGDIIIPIKYTMAERILGQYLKLASSGKYALYDKYGTEILPQEYSSIDLLFGGMFLTCKNNKYGVIKNTGDVILENKFDDIYMPKPNIMRISYMGSWYEIEQKQGEALELPDNIKNIKEDSRFAVSQWAARPATAMEYSVLTGTDYFLKLFSSISPAHEKTIDELMLSQGAETVSILFKLGWLPKYPVVYARNYFQTIKTPNNGPLSEVKYELKRKLQ